MASPPCTTTDTTFLRPSLDPCSGFPFLWSTHGCTRARTHTHLTLTRPPTWAINLRSQGAQPTPYWAYLPRRPIDTTTLQPATNTEMFELINAPSAITFLKFSVIIICSQILPLPLWLKCVGYSIVAVDYTCKPYLRFCSIGYGLTSK